MRRSQIVAAALCAAALALAPCAQAAPVGYWTFDGNANDSSANGNDGTVAGGAVYDAGRFGQALLCDGLNGHVTVADSPSLQIGPYTVSAWIRPVVNTNWDGWTGVIGKPGRNYNIWLGNSANPGGGFIHHRWHDFGGTNSGAGDAYTVPMDTWTHVAITNDGTTGRTYINGYNDPAWVGGVNTQLVIDNTTLYFARSLDGEDNRYFKGHVDDVAIWGEALPATVIQSLADGSTRPMDLGEPRARLEGQGTPCVRGAAYGFVPADDRVVGPVHWKVERLAMSAPIVAYEVPAGQAGNQQHGGPLGMEFDVNSDVRITELGVFDHLSDGIFRDINVRLYDRTSPGSPLATLDFSTADPGVLVDGSRFKPLATPIDLPAGFQGCIVADGYGPGEDNGNGMGNPVPWTTDDGGGALSFVGGGLWDMTPGSYPVNVDSGPANRYAAGTFAYSAMTVTELLAEGDYNVGDPDESGLFLFLSQPEEYYLRLTVSYSGQDVSLEGLFMGVPEPTTLSLLAFGGVGLLLRRRRRH